MANTLTKAGAAAMCLLAPLVSAPAQARPSESVLTFKTEKVADGVYAFITPEERSGFQSGNSVAVIGDDAVLVFDTGNIPSSTRRQIAEIRTLTTKPVRYVVNSHWHPDHNLGNAEYRAAFPSAVFIGTSATRQGILERVPGYFDQMKSFSPSDSSLRTALARGTTRDGRPLPDNLRLMWDIITRDYAAFMPEVLTAKPLAPELVFDDSLTIDLGRRIVKIVRPGRGNTAGDAYVYVPDSRTLLTGDLLTMPCPFPGTAFFSDWIKGLDQLEALRAANVVPGHGDVQHDYGYLGLVRELLTFTRTGARDAVRKGLTLEQTQKSIDFTDFIKRFGAGDTVRAESFTNFYSQAAVQRAYEEAKLESEGPVKPRG
jgi:glyoxylase-like metal-dependent hydrolase (beta-lactamase superfamily II)